MIIIFTEKNDNTMDKIKNANIMKIIIKAEADSGSEQMMFADDYLNNVNLVDIVIDDKEYTISLSDLEAVVKAFKTRNHGY